MTTGMKRNLFAMALPMDAVRRHEITQTMLEHVAEGENFIQVHPTFLYESLWNLAVFGLLLWWSGRKKFHGEVCLFYLGGYGLGRMWIEGLRTDQLLLPGTQIAVSQMLSLCLVLFAVGLDVIVRRRMKKRKET